MPSSRRTVRGRNVGWSCRTTFGGCLATLVPADKKKIHGMSDGTLIPCVVED